jgi:hypothetical protein
LDYSISVSGINILYCIIVSSGLKFFDELKYILILWILLSIKTFGQPGYLGKKTSLGFNFECSPYSLKLIQGIRETFVDDKYFRLVKSYNLNYARVINRRFEFVSSVGLGFRSYVGQRVFDRSTGDLEYFVPLVESYKVNEYKFDAGFKRYFRGKIAPIGWYQQFVLG